MSSAYQQREATAAFASVIENGAADHEHRLLFYARYRRTWAVDPAHSNVGFAVKHMGLATVRGVFTEFDGLIEIGEDLSTAKAYAMVNVESLDTNQPQRDEHLRSPDFFDTGQYPSLRFESTAITALDEQTFRIVGRLTIHGALDLTAVPSIVSEYHR